MIPDILMTVLSLGLILLSCSVFINAIEWLGQKLNLHQGIIGSIFAAIGTRSARDDNTYHCHTFRYE